MTMRRKQGRPTTFGQPLHPELNIDTADAIVNAVRAGAFIDTAAAAAGIPRGTLNTWLTVGARTATAVASGEKDPDTLTPYEQALRDFSLRINKAFAEWDIEANAQLQQLSRRHVGKTSTVITRDATGQVIEQTTRSEEVEPDWRIIAWRLERKDWGRYGPRLRSEVTGKDGGPIEMADRTSALLDVVREARAQEAAALGSGADAVTGSVLDGLLSQDGATEEG